MNAKNSLLVSSEVTITKTVLNKGGLKAISPLNDPSWTFMTKINYYRSDWLRLFFRVLNYILYQCGTAFYTL